MVQADFKGLYMYLMLCIRDLHAEFPQVTRGKTVGMRRIFVG